VHAESLQQLQQPTAPIHDTWNTRDRDCERKDQEWDCDAGEHGRGEVAAGPAVAQYMAQQLIALEGRCYVTGRDADR